MQLYQKFLMKCFSKSCCKKIIRSEKKINFFLTEGVNADGINLLNSCKYKKFSSFKNPVCMFLITLTTGRN